MAHRVSTVRDENLCISCGMCASVCPQRCIEFHHKNGMNLPFIHEETCSNCGKCFDVCAGKGFDYGIYGSNYGGDFGLKNAEKIYIARTKDPEILRNATSGGIATEIIRALLSKNTLWGGGMIIPS